MNKSYIVIFFITLLVSSNVLADGTEVLGPPSIPIANGTGIATAGTGMINQPASISIDIPDGAQINQVLLYWQGFMWSHIVGDNSLTVMHQGTSYPVTGTKIGGVTDFLNGLYASTFRSDITNLNIISDGTNSFSLDDLDYGRASNGAGIIVIYDDGSSDAQVNLRDGSDLAWIGYPSPINSTVAQTFSFPPSSNSQTAMLDLFFASVSGTVSGNFLRPTAIEITVGGNTTVLHNVLDSIDGDEFDSFTISANIPAGASTVTVQAFSRDDLNIGNNPASFDWIAAAFSLEPEVPMSLPGRMTGGGSAFRIDNIRVTRGFQIHCDLRNPNNLQINWPGHKFHLTDLTAAVCTDSPAIDQLPRKAPFDTFKGIGTGLLNRQPGATIEFEFVDAGEPGTNDTASMKIYDANGDLVLDVTGDPNIPAYLNKGNIQAHKDNQSSL